MTLVRGAPELVPALVRVWCRQAPVFEPIARRGDHWLLGRETLADDDRMSRRHCEVRHSPAGWVIEDLGSANGTHVDGRAWSAPRPHGPWKVLQIGRSLIIPLVLPRDVPLHITHDEWGVVGPSLHGCMAAVRGAAGDSAHVVLAGKRGCGFEDLARRYARERGEALTVHDLQQLPASAPAPAPGVALLTGASIPQRYASHPWVRGALQRRDLRLVLGLEWEPRHGAPTLPGPLASATRLIPVPPLEARPEEVPWLIVAALPGATGIAVDLTFPEACLLRRWGDGIPSLRSETRNAAAHARARNPSQPLLQARDLSWGAGHRTGDVIFGDGSPPPRGARVPAPALLERETLLRALAEAGGDRQLAATRMRIAVATLERWIRHHGLDEPA